jgi:hypothetical protein
MEKIKFILMLFSILLSKYSFSANFINDSILIKNSEPIFEINNLNNNNLKYKIIEGDIIYDQNQNYNRDIYSAPLNYSKKKWNNGKIYYSFHLYNRRNKNLQLRKFSHYEKSLIRNAMDKLENIADIKFIEVYHKPFHNYLEIMVDEGCFSGIGSDHPQTVSLGDGCLYPEIIQHELMHALGFLHEQNRSDRNYYLKIIKENIIPGKENNFDLGPYSTIQFGPYDYYSIMHYGLNSFSIDPRKYTMVPLLNGVYWEYIGNAKTLSILDREALQRAYGKVKN